MRGLPWFPAGIPIWPTSRLCQIFTYLSGVKSYSGVVCVRGRLQGRVVLRGEPLRGAQGRLRRESSACVGARRVVAPSRKSLW